MAVAALLGAVAAGCASPRMKPLPASAAARSWPVTGHTTDKYSRARALRVGSYAVSDLKGTAIAMPGMAAYGRMAEQRQWKYAFDVASGPARLHAECDEAVDHSVLYGLGGVALNLYCTCSEGSEARAQLSFDGEKGRVVLRGRGYELSAAHVSDQNESMRALLGYGLRSSEGEGAVELAGGGQVLVPRDVTAEAEPAFACISAALLLHRPLQ